jgi:DNA-directed RNA polymerase specialized sigma24 family protein
VTEEEFDDELRRSAFAVAYRMLGSVSEVEDVVQEGFLRLHGAAARGRRADRVAARKRTTGRAVLRHREGMVISVTSLDVAEAQIQDVSSIVNPDKLRHLGPRVLPAGDLPA